ncbi:sigma-70 family RNA polymerase sigma factor [Candidatus Woesearchaeota archaeon]|nr:sigma-70 family RNA polymerase sigma factor [Candidatus Woesearchaeota archaeon]
MVEPNYSRELLHYIPDPSKREMKAGRIEGLETAVLRAVQKSVQPLMTAISLENVDAYLSQKYGKEIVLNGQGEALKAYEYEGKRFYRRSDLDALEITIPKEIPTPPVQEDKEEKNPPPELRKDEETIIPAEKEIEEGKEQEEEPKAREPIAPKAEPVPPPVYTNAERTERFLPPSRDEIEITPAMLLYHALARYGVLEKGNKEGVARVEEALEYISHLQRGILELYYVKGGVARRIEERFGITHSQYIRERKTAEDIMKAVLAGTYNPLAKRETKEKPPRPSETTHLKKESKYGDDPLQWYKDHCSGMTRTELQKKHKGLYARLHQLNLIEHVPKKERYARRSNDEETEEPDEEEQKPTQKKKPAEAKPQRMSERQKDLLRRFAEHRATHGKPEDEELTPEIEGERLYYATKQWKTVAALEDALNKSHAQANQIDKLRGKKLPDDFARITDGDATIDFLVRDECYAIADVYVREVYTRAVEGVVWPISDEHIQKQEKENPRDPKKKIKVKEEEIRAGFVAAYEAYLKKPSEDALIALFKNTPRLSRGYIATVGWYFASKDEKDEKRKGDWNGSKWRYTPTWKDAWTFFVPDKNIHRKKRTGTPVLLSEPQFGHLLEGSTEKVLRSRYRQLWYHAETARGNTVTKYTGFAVSQAKKFDWTEIPLSDRISLAKEGLLRASQKYDPTSDSNFATYASHWIKAMITREHRGSSNIRITANMWEKIFKIQREIKDIKKDDLDIDEEELYALVQERTGIARETIKTALQAVADYNSVVSLDDKAYSEAGSKGRNEKRLSDMIADKSAIGVDEEAVQKDQGENLKRARNGLTERENYVLDRRFDGGDWEGQTLSEVGKEMGLSRERVRQIQLDALDKLRGELNKPAPRISEEDKASSNDTGKQRKAVALREHREEDMIVGTAIPNTYTGQAYSPEDPETQEITRRFTPSSRDIVERYYMRGESLVKIRADTKQPLEHIVRLLENAGKLLPK